MRTGAVALASVSVLATAIHAQQPQISPALERVASSDSTLAVWLMARPETNLREVESVLSGIGANVRHRSRWLHAISADIDQQALALLRRSTLLRRLQPIAAFVGPTRPRGMPVAVLPRASRVTSNDSTYGPSAMPLRQLNLFPLVDGGIRGSGVRIAILDTGFETELPAFDGVSIAAQ